MLRWIPKSQIFRLRAAPIPSVMIGAIAVYMGLIGYVKDNTPNYHHLPCQLANPHSFRYIPVDVRLASVGTLGQLRMKFFYMAQQ